ncbi:MAG: hypothetical protein KJI72_00115 [Patescibacteria group bacterium]|nr:hypothetical protein [Patescibacteria group bacterium]
MRTAITRAVEEIRTQYNLSDEVIADEFSRMVKINLPAIKKEIAIKFYTPKADIKKQIRQALKEEKLTQKSFKQNRLI